MKTHKITKLLGIGLTLMLMVSILAIAAPVTAKDPGEQQWANGSEPGPSALVMSNGSDITDFAVGSDGVAYLVDGANNNTRRSSSGTVWASINNHAAGDEALVAVAADNSDCIALVDGTTDTIYISNDAGVTFSSLPALTGIYAPASIKIMDIAVGPARSGTLLGREYAIAVSDNAAATVTGGDVLIIGQTATWTPVVAAVTGTADFVAVKFSPNYAGDRVLLAVGANATPGASLYLMNTSTTAQLVNSPVTFEANITDFDITAGAAAAIASADIAVASDFDPTDANAYRAWVAVASNTAVAAEDGVYRIDGPTATNLNIVGATTAQAIDSIAYSGTNDAGTLFGGYCNTTPVSVVKRTANPQSNTPTWTTTKNNPTGSTFTRVAVAPDFGSTNRVMVGTAGTESAWSLSDDGGVSFYQRAYVDNGALDSGLPQNGCRFVGRESLGNTAQIQHHAFSLEKDGAVLRAHFHLAVLCEIEALSNKPVGRHAGIFSADIPQLHQRPDSYVEASLRQGGKGQSALDHEEGIL